MNYYILLINDVIDYIEENLESKLSLPIIANRTGMSAFHFTRIFRVVTGISLKQYTINRKLAKAQVLLTETQTSIIEIALTLGFEYPEVFNRASKRHVGQSPSAFRKTNEAFRHKLKTGVYAFGNKPNDSFNGGGNRLSTFSSQPPRNCSY